MNKQEILNKLQDKLEETFKCQKCFPTESDIYFTYEAAAVAYMTAINYVEQLEETSSQKMELNENQLIVLKWLKTASEWMGPFGLFHELSRIYSGAPENALCAVQQLDRDQQLQVLAAFAEWGMKNE